MGLQEINCTHSSIFFMGMYKLKEHSNKMIELIRSEISPMIPGFDDEDSNNWIWDNWYILNHLLDPFTINKTMISESGGKNDVSQLMLQIPKQAGVCVQVYNLLKENNLLKEPDKFKVTFEFDKSLEVNFKKWVTFLTSYETILQIYDSMITLNYNLSSIYYSPLQRKLTPAQMGMFNSDLMKIMLDENPYTLPSPPAGDNRGRPGNTGGGLTVGTSIGSGGGSTPSGSGISISTTGYPTVYELWGIITRLNTENLNDFDLAYNFRDGFNPNNDFFSNIFDPETNLVYLGFTIMPDIGPNPPYIERMRSPHDSSTFCFYIPPKVTYICCIIYAPRDLKQGLVCRFKQPPDALHINDNYADINWGPYTQVHFPDDYYEDVYLSTLGGHAEAVNTAASATGFTESGWFFIKITNGFVLGDVTLIMKMDYDDYVEWYNNCQWDANGNPMM